MNVKLLFVCTLCMAVNTYAASATVKYYSDKTCTKLITSGTCASSKPTCDSLKTEFKVPKTSCKVTGCSFSFDGMNDGTTCAASKAGWEKIGCLINSFNPVSYRKVVVTCAPSPIIGKWKQVIDKLEQGVVSQRACMILNETGATIHQAVMMKQNPSFKCSPDFVRFAGTSTATYTYENVTKAADTTSFTLVLTGKDGHLTTLEPKTATCDGRKVDYEASMTQSMKEDNGKVVSMCRGQVKAGTFTSFCRESTGGARRRRITPWSNCPKTYPPAGTSKESESDCISKSVYTKATACGVMVPVAGAAKTTLVWGAVTGATMLALQAGFGA